MTNSTPFLGYEKSQLLKAALVILVALAVVFLGPLWMKGMLGVALGIAGLVVVILVKRGIKEPKSFRPLRTPVGVLLLSIGVLGFGLDDLLTAFEVPGSSGFGLQMILEAVLVVMILCLFVGIVVEWRAWRNRPSPPVA